MHRNAAKSVRPPAMRQVERRALGVDEAKRLLDVLRGHGLEALCVCALAVGLRRGELLGLAWTGCGCMTCGTFLLVSGASPRTVMKVLGHSQIGLTMNTYVHILPEIERAAVDEAAKRLFG
ncbi:hypothetical protein [Micromonospora sp. NPDC007230]|uniref:hypothetical protein n=1 Tax=Micromonospora sp. NPDC007230 TaxID=3364237 RepID=UPI0036A6B4B7